MNSSSSSEVPLQPPRTQDRRPIFFTFIVCWVCTVIALGIAAYSIGSEHKHETAEGETQIIFVTPDRAHFFIESSLFHHPIYGTTHVRSPLIGYSSGTAAICKKISVKSAKRSQKQSQSSFSDFEYDGCDSCGLNMICGPDGLRCVCSNSSYVQEGNQCVARGASDRRVIARP